MYALFTSVYNVHTRLRHTDSVLSITTKHVYIYTGNFTWHEWNYFVCRSYIRKKPTLFNIVVETICPYCLLYK